MKLDGPSNYREWAFSVKTILRGHGLASHLADSPVDKSKDGLAVMAWTNDDERVMSDIVTSMEPSLIMSLEHHESAKEMWDYLQGQYIQIFRIVVLFCLH
jgi:hypothetical protein